MRALFLTAIISMSFGLDPLLAQEQQKQPSSTSQQVQTQGQLSGPAKQDPEPGNRSPDQRIMDRQGLGIDWDHRKPGRDWQVSPDREGGGVNRD